MSWLSDAANTVSNTASRGYDAATQAYQDTTRTVGDFGSVAVQKASDLGRQGLDTGRHALDAVTRDVSHAAIVVKRGVADAGDAVQSAAQSGWQDAKQINHDYQVVDRALGALRAVGGGLEVAAGASLFAAGAATSEIGVGFLGMAGGGVIMAHGLDQTQAGVRQAVDAKPHDDLTSQGLQAAGVPQGVANGIDAGASIVFSVGGAAGAKGIAAATERAAVAAERAGASGPLNRASFETYKDVLRADMAKPATTDPKLTSILDKLYRPNAQVGSGSTTAAVRTEMATGQSVGGAFHTQKAEDSIVTLSKWLERNPTASPGDRAAAENVIRDMQNALAGH